MKLNSIIRFVGLLICAGIVHVGGASAATEKVLYSFCPNVNCTDGDTPMAGLINVKGTLYGTTFGGNATDGSVFSISPKTSAETTVYSFSINGSSAFAPAAGVIDVGGTLYGTTEYGGTGTCSLYAPGCGTVFEVNPTNGAETVVYSFQGGTDGINPIAGLIDVGGTLYGTTEGGGTGSCGPMDGFDGCGTVFSINPSNGAETVLHSFQNNGTDGTIPVAGLIDVGGTLYGTTQGGGANGYGTVFKVTHKTVHGQTQWTETVVYSFQNNGTDGAYPQAGLIDVGGILYGTTSGGGGANGYGTVFKVDPKTGAESVMYSFCSQGGGNCTDGVNPEAGLIDVGGTLYGTTNGGGANSSGTVFSLNLKTGAEAAVWSFGSGTDGFFPAAGLINVGRTLYGTTSEGGTTNYGTVFSVNP